MHISQKILANHKVKSSQVRELKDKLKNSISKNKLKEKLQQEKAREVRSSDYLGMYGFDDNGYNKACIEIEARIKLLEELLH